MLEVARLAGRIADGVVIGSASPPTSCLVPRAAEAGARDGGRTLDDLEVWFTCFWWVHEEPGRARADGAWSATAFALHFADSGVEGKFIPDELKLPLLEIGNAYDLKTHGHPTEEQKAGYVELADRLGVGDYLRERFMLAGTPDEVERQIRTAMDAGARNFDGAIDADLKSTSGGSRAGPARAPTLRGNA